MKQILFFIFFSFSYVCVFSQDANKIPPHKPKLIVGIVVEQMRYDYISKFWTIFEEEGFRRMFTYGANCKNTYLEYAYTQSAPGFASIATGCPPSQHGIVSDKWYNYLKNEEVDCIEDSDYKTVGGKPHEQNSSPRQLLSSTLSDQLKIATHNKAKVYSVALEPSSAVLTSGYLSDGAYWIDEVNGKWSTSSFYATKLPSWLDKINDENQPDYYLTQTWDYLKDENLYEISNPDKSEFELGFDKRNYFPYNLQKYTSSFRTYKFLQEIPQGNTLVKDMAVNLIMEENLGKDFTTDMVTICFNSGAGVANRFGINSREIQDYYLRLDQEIGSLLSFIEKEIGKENCVVYLTSSSGSSQDPRYLESLRMPGGYFKHMQAVALLKSYLNAVYGEGDWVKHYHKQQLYLNRSLIENSKLKLEDVQNTAAEFLIQFSGVANVLTSTALQRNNYTSGAFAKIQNSYSQKRSGDILILLESGWIEQTLSSCTDHNTPYSYDTHVPLAWWGWKIERKTIQRNISITDIAITLATFLNVEPPSKTTGNAIWELTGNY